VLKTGIYHNPKCSKSRQTLSLLQDNGIEPTVIEYIKTPPDAETLGQILEMLELSPRDLIRGKEYAELGLPDGANDDELIQQMVNNPVIIQRPIVVNNQKARIGRPPEDVLEII